MHDENWVTFNLDFSLRCLALSLLVLETFPLEKFP